MVATPSYMRSPGVWCQVGKFEPMSYYWALPEYGDVPGYSAQEEVACWPQYTPFVANWMQEFAVSTPVIMDHAEHGPGAPMFDHVSLYVSAYLWARVTVCLPRVWARGSLPKIPDCMRIETVAGSYLWSAANKQYERYVPPSNPPSFVMRVHQPNAVSPPLPSYPPYPYHLANPPCAPYPPNPRAPAKRGAHARQQILYSVGPTPGDPK